MSVVDLFVLRMRVRAEHFQVIFCFFDNEAYCEHRPGFHAANVFGFYPAIGMADDIAPFN